MVSLCPASYLPSFLLSPWLPALAHTVPWLSSAFSVLRTVCLCSAAALWPGCIFNLFTRNTPISVTSFSCFYLQFWNLFILLICSVPVVWSPHWIWCPPLSAGFASGPLLIQPHLQCVCWYLGVLSFFPWLWNPSKLVRLCCHLPCHPLQSVSPPHISYRNAFSGGLHW